MALMSSASNRVTNNYILFPNNRTLIHSHKFQLHCHKSYLVNSLNTSLSSKYNRTTTISAVSSSSAPPDVVEIDGSSSLIASSTISSKWVEFANKVSGEWDGYGADFSSEGEPIELPEQVVPEAFREWEVKVFDWQTQCPTLAQPQDFTIFYKLIKLLPTVGCEADAATQYSIEERNIGGADNFASAFAYQSSGCYAAVWSMKDHPTYRILELEHCLVDPRSRESRVRIIQVVHVEKSKFMLKNIKVFCEQWYGPFRNGEQLGGCAIRDTAFASTDALTSSEVTGVWEGLHAVACFQNSQTNTVQELLDDNVRKSVRDENNLVLLPKQLWSSVKDREDETFCEVGWLFDQGHAITSKCIFSPDAGLKEIVIAHETSAGIQ
ncbi:uncharacterized protein LOC131325517 [Rhododendron vialii]|uniref:uncharacterized protein LOC131325517 n=1 Tax=Rhododendron vialii TaxID=182163 RepID=UPI00265F17B6|nr:uncharacterized protein LOC131325517 [Rhododendron vialii]